jgi:hypothetical protein
MKIFSLGDFNDETLNKFIEFSNKNWEDEWCIYVDSNGGANIICGLISEILSKKLLQPQEVYLNIARAYSSAFRLMMDFKGVINIMNMGKAMYHQTAIEIHTNLIGKETGSVYNNYEIILKDSHKTELKNRIEFCKTFMADKELQDYKDGKDIYYNEKQLINIIKNKNKL